MGIEDYQSNLKSVLGANVSSTVADYFIENGYVYTTRKVYTIPTGITNIIFDSSVIPIFPNPGSKFLIVQPPVLTAVGGDYCIVNLYNGGTYSGGTVEGALNRDEESGINNDSFLVYNPTILTPGTLAPVQFLVPAASQGASTAGGSAQSNLAQVFTPGIKRIEINNSGIAQQFEILFSWAEIPRS